MNKNIFKLSAAVAAFIVGVIFSGLWLSDSFSNKSAVNEESAQIIKVEIAPSPMMSDVGGIACGTDSFGNPASFSTYTAADGTKFSSTLVYGLKSEKKARKRMRQVIKNAVKVIELSPNLDYWQRKIGEKAIAQLKDGFVLVKYQRDSADDEDYQVSIIETATLEQALKIDKDQKAFANSLIVNKLK